MHSSKLVITVWDTSAQTAAHNREHQVSEQASRPPAQQPDLHTFRKNLQQGRLHHICAQRNVRVEFPVLRGRHATDPSGFIYRHRQTHRSFIQNNISLRPLARYCMYEANRCVHDCDAMRVEARPAGPAQHLNHLRLLHALVAPGATAPAIRTLGGLLG